MGAGCSSDNTEKLDKFSGTTPVFKTDTRQEAVVDKQTESFAEAKRPSDKMFKAYSDEQTGDARPEISWKEVLNQVADKDLWEGIKREERPQWREYLKKADEISRKQRKPISKRILTSILEGDFSLDVHEIPSAQPKVGVFVSSTFTDTKAERNVLMRDVYPYIRMLCRRLGVDFGTVDMRWGVTEEATLDHSTVAMCVKEIQKCIKNSAGPAFVCLLSHKYGYRPLPAAIDQSELDKMTSFLENQNEDVSLINNYYSLDLNAVPPEYVLKARNKADKNWWTNSDKMQEQMRTASAACFGDDKNITNKYFLSVTETEVNTGVFNNPKFESQAIFIQRDLKEVTSAFHLDRKIVDMKDDGSIDEYAQQKLNELRKEKVKDAAPENIVLEVGYQSAKRQAVVHEIKNVCDRLCKELVERILQYYEENLHVKVDTTFQEAMQHRGLAIDKSSLFIGRETELRRIADYLKSDNTKPLVIHGRSGCGKTALIAVCAKTSITTVPNSMVVLRFLGTTGQSGSARSLLLSLCTQISKVYGKEELLARVPTSYKELIKYFRTCMGLSSESKPLSIYLDSLDQLSNEDFAHNLAWLSLNENLPPYTKLVVSSLPTSILDILRRSVPEENIVEVKQLDMNEGPKILDKMLGSEKRRITETQQNIIMKAFAGCPLPLFLRLAADIALRWHSFDNVTEADIAGDMPGLITKLFERLESRYGEIFVHHALSYITVAKYGLSLAELEDVLSCDDVVLDVIFEWWIPPFRRIPPLLWARVRNELGIYLAERGTDGISAYGWYHRQFWETARERYLDKTFGSNAEPFIEKAHEAVADYFDGKWISGKLYPDPDNPNPKKKDIKPKIENRQLPAQPLVVSGDRESGRQLNKRMLNELPYHLIKLKDWERFLKLVLNLEYIEVKFEAGLGYDCLSELIEATKLSGDETIQLLTRFVGSNLAFLLNEAFAVYQVALELPPSHSLRGLLESDFPFPAKLMKNLREEDFEDPCEMTLQGHTETLRCCNFSTKGDLIASSADDGTLRIWDTITGAELVTVTSLPLPVWPGQDEPIQLMLHPVNPCCFSRTGDVIGQGTEHGDVMLWDVSGVQLKEVKTGNNAVTYIGFSLADTHIATSFKNGKVIIWQASDLTHITSTDLKMETTGLHYSPDGQWLAVSCLPGLAVLNTSNYNLEWFGRKAGLMLCCTFHPIKSQVMTGGDDSGITIWNVDHQKVSQVLKKHTAWIWSIQFTKDGDYMFSCSSDRSMKVWRDNGGWSVIASVGGHSHRVSMASIQPGKEEKMVTSSLDRSLKVWNLKLLKQGKVPPVGGMHFNICTAYPQTTYIVTSQGWMKNCAILADGKPLGRSIAHGGFIKKAEFSADGKKLITLDTGHSGGYETGSEKRAELKITSIPGCSTICNGLDISAPTSFAVGSTLIAAGTATGEVVLFDLETLQSVKTWKTDHQMMIKHMAYSRTHGHIVTCFDKTATVWNNRYEPLKLVKDLGDEIVHCTISPDGNHLAIGLDSGRICIWRLSDNSVDLLHTISVHTSYIRDIEFNETGTRMASAGGLSLRIWDVSNNFKMIGAYYGPVSVTCFLGDVIVAGEATGNLKYLSF